MGSGVKTHILIFFNVGHMRNLATVASCTPHGELLHKYCCFKSHNRSRHGTVIQSDILEIYNLVENSYQYNTMELLENPKHSYWRLMFVSLVW